MNTPDPNLVFGYAQVAELLGINVNALHQRKNRNRLSIAPLYRIGRMSVFDREQVLAYKGECEARKNVTHTP